jgi:hypothetical protein
MISFINKTRSLRTHQNTEIIILLILSLPSDFTTLNSPTMPSIQSIILATLAVMATTTVAAPGLPRVPIATDIVSSFPTPGFSPDIVVRTPGGPTVYLPPVKDVSGDIIARAPEDPKVSFQYWDPKLPLKMVARAPEVPAGEFHTGPPPFVGTWEELSAGGILARAPIPDSASSVETVAGMTEVTYTVDCGCWNICTLEKVINKDVICPAVCGTLSQL